MEDRRRGFRPLRRAGREGPHSGPDVHAVRAVPARPGGSRSVTTRTRQRFDGVVIATHPDQALGLLAHRQREAEVLGARLHPQPYRPAHRQLACCRPPRAQASWNYGLPACGRAASVHLSYNMNRLQRLRHARDYMVTLNDGERVDPDRRRPDGLRAPGVHHRIGPRPATAARAQRRHSPSRRLPRLGIPRGRLPLRRRCGREPGGDW